MNDNVKSSHFSEKNPFYRNHKEIKILEELEEIDKLILKEPKKEGLSQDEDFNLKNEEFFIYGEDLRNKGMKMTKIKKLNFLTDLLIKKR